MGYFRKKAKLTFPLKKKELSEFKPIFVVHITSVLLILLAFAFNLHPMPTYQVRVNGT